MTRSSNDILARLAARLPLVAIAAVALQGCAHFPRSDEPLELMEPITVGVPVGQGQLLEAHPAIHVVFHNGLDVPDAFEERRLATTVSFSFLAAIRMYDEPSSPVRTPSYAPRLKLQLVGVTPVGREVVLGWRVSGDVLVRPVPLLPRPDLDSRLRASASGKVHVGLGAGRSPFGDAALEVAWLPRYRRELLAGPFVRYRFGSDDLNIRFEERLDEWIAGVLVDFAPPERLGPRSP